MSLFRTAMSMPLGSGEENNCAETLRPEHILAFARQAGALAAEEDPERGLRKLLEWLGRTTGGGTVALYRIRETSKEPSLTFHACYGKHDLAAMKLPKGVDAFLPAANDMRVYGGNIPEALREYARELTCMLCRRSGDWLLCLLTEREIGQGELQSQAQRLRFTAELARGFLDRIGTWDPATGRRSLVREIDALVHTGHKLRLYYVRVRNARQLQDGLGYANFTQRLRNVRMRISSRHPGAIVYPLAEDSIGVLSMELQGPGDQTEKAIRDSFDAEETDGQARSVPLEPQIGWVCLPEDAMEGDAALENARRACESLTSGPAAATAQQYEPWMSLEAARAGAAAVLLGRIKAGRPLDDLVRLAYQPRYSLATGRIAGIETLIRIVEAANALPSIFVEMLERSEYIHEAGQWVIATACREYLSMRSRRIDTGRLSINVSPAQLCRQGFAERTIRTILDVGCDPCEVDLEITESQPLLHNQIASQELARLAAHGVSLTLDDLGSGYSIWGCLALEGITHVKVDRHILWQAQPGRQGEAVFREIIAAMKRAGMEVTVEGVETQQQMEMVARSEADMAQGFWIARPMSMQDILQADGFRKALDVRGRTGT